MQAGLCVGRQYCEGLPRAAGRGSDPAPTAFVSRTQQKQEVQRPPPASEVCGETAHHFRGCLGGPAAAVRRPPPGVAAMAKKAQRPALVWTLRAFLLLNFCSALGFIIYALILENPPKTALPL